MLPEAPERKTKRLSFRADETTCKKLAEIATALHMKKSDVVRQLIDETYKELKLNKK